MSDDGAALLIGILNDPDATRRDERDDAAMALGEYDGEDVERALAAFVVDAAADDLLQSSAAESLAEIWIRRGTFDAALVKQATRTARAEIVGLSQ